MKLFFQHDTIKLTILIHKCRMDWDFYFPHPSKTEIMRRTTEGLNASPGEGINY